MEDLSLKEFRDAEEGAIHFRDDLQFELKSEFVPLPILKHNRVVQEFYLFVPSELQINPQTYSKEDFYKDETNFIRFKTPEFRLSELYSLENIYSPLNRVLNFLSGKIDEKAIEEIRDEVKLFGNIFRSALRKSTLAVVALMRGETKAQFLEEGEKLLEDVVFLKEKYRVILDKALEFMHLAQLTPDFRYVDEFISNTAEFYLIDLLKELRSSKEAGFELFELKVGAALKEEKEYRNRHYTESHRGLNGKIHEDNELILYRQGLLKKFVQDALLLASDRIALVQRYSHFAGAVAAGIAMFVYIGFFVWNSRSIAINSVPFLVLTVFLYVLKDRLKEGLRTLFFQRAGLWFPDYTTEIFTPNRLLKLGKLKEVIYYKKEVILHRLPERRESRRKALNNIFRFNIHSFIQKANNPWRSFLALNYETMELKVERVPKVYHINIIIKTSVEEKSDIKKFRLILDKSGIKRVDQVVL